MHETHVVIQLLAQCFSRWTLMKVKKKKKAQLCKPNTPISPPVSVARIMVERGEKWIEEWTLKYWDGFVHLRGCIFLYLLFICANINQVYWETNKAMQCILLMTKSAIFTLLMCKVLRFVCHATFDRSALSMCMTDKGFHFVVHWVRRFSSTPLSIDTL